MSSDRDWTFEECSDKMAEAMGAGLWSAALRWANEAAKRSSTLQERASTFGSTLEAGTGLDPVEYGVEVDPRDYDAEREGHNWYGDPWGNAL